ncbi:MAG: host attachment protein [Gammaproteobacteria bacterium]|nr:host attachment protein [Gammaproteobacteria bacterium]
MVVIWVLVADGSRGRLFRAEGARGGLIEIDTWLHPESRLREQDLVTDAPGHDRGRGGGAHGVNENHSARDHELEAFAREIAQRLQAALNEDAFGRLVLCAPPRFLGLLRDALPAAVRQRVRHEIGKDLTSIKDLRDLRKRLPDVLYAELDGA